MRYSTSAALLAAVSASVALAQNSTNSTGDAYTTGLVTALQGLGLTTLSGVLGVRSGARDSRIGLGSR